MKRILLSLAILVMTASLAFGAGTVTVTAPTFNYEKDKAFISIAWVGDAGGGTLPATTINMSSYKLIGWYLYSVETDPGDTAPTDNYDITITDANSLDICYSQALNRDTANTEIAFCSASGKGFYVVRGSLTVNISGNAVNSATGTIILTLLKN
jgi:hypothetical protein